MPFWNVCIPQQQVDSNRIQLIALIWFLFRCLHFISFRMVNRSNLLFHISISNEYKWPTVKQLIQLKHFGHFFLFCFDFYLTQSALWCVSTHWKFQTGFFECTLQTGIMLLKNTQIVKKGAKECKRFSTYNFTRPFTASEACIFKLLPSLFQSLSLVSSYSSYSSRFCNFSRYASIYFVDYLNDEWKRNNSTFYFHRV